MNLSKRKGYGAENKAPLFVYLFAAACCMVDQSGPQKGRRAPADGPSDKAPCLPNLSPPTGHAPKKWVLLISDRDVTDRFTASPLSPMII